MQRTKSVLAYLCGSRPCVSSGKAVERPATARFAALVLAVATAWVACGAAAAPLLDEPIQPVPLTLKQDPARAEIGRQLFRDTRLSGNGRVSCASCHDISKGGGDGRDRSVGLNGGLTSVNAPTVLNAALNFKQFWNGRAESLESQADHVMQNPVEMGSQWAEVVQKVSQDPKYKAAFAASYKDGVTKANIQNAIATFERTLITPNSRFDNTCAATPTRSRPRRKPAMRSSSSMAASPATRA